MYPLSSIGRVSTRPLVESLTEKYSSSMSRLSSKRLAMLCIPHINFSPSIGGITLAYLNHLIYAQPIFADPWLVLRSQLKKLPQGRCRPKSQTIESAKLPQTKLIEMFVAAAISGVL